MANCLVTGGAGFIGSHIADELVSIGHKVKILDNFSTGSKENLSLLSQVSSKVEIVEGSITDKKIVDECVKDTEYIFHHAAFVSVPESIKKPKTTWEINIRGTKLLLNAAVANKVKRFVFASSAAVYGNNPELPKKEEMNPDPVSPYGQSKRMGELLCDEYKKKEKLSTICLRYFNVYGPRQNPYSDYAGVISKFISSVIINQGPVIYGSGEQTRDFIYVKDVVTANMLAMEKNVSGSFNIGTGKPNSINQLLGAINLANGTEIIPVHKHEREGDITFSYADIEKARKKLSFVAKYSIENGIKETFDWYKQNMKEDMRG